MKYNSIIWEQVSEQEKWLLQEVLEECGVLPEAVASAVSVCVKQTDRRGLRIEKAGAGAVIEYGKLYELARAAGLLVQHLAEGEEAFLLEEVPVFEDLCLMQDCSRNAVVKVDTVKKILRQLALMGYSSMQLYTEDTYEMEGEPYFGYMRGRYSANELKELSAYAAGLGMELVPCIQTLAHLNGALRWDTYWPLRDAADILTCGLEETYQFIEKMVKTCAECFSSRRINIGMDEAELLGRGAYLKHFPYEERSVIMKRHLERVLKICEKYGFRAMMWSDMFFKMFSGGRYYATNLQIREEDKQVVPENVTLMYWDYYATKRETYDRMLDLHQQISSRIGFAGGAWRWSGWVPQLPHSRYCAELALPSLKEHGIKEVVVTAWGDNGAECPVLSIMPILQQYAEYSYEQTQERSWISDRLRVCTGMEYELWFKLSEPDIVPDYAGIQSGVINPSKYLLYQDPLLGIFDVHVKESYPEHYKECAQWLEEAAQNAGEYAYLFETIGALCRVLEMKSDFGIRLKRAYDDKNREVLEQLQDECLEIVRRVERFRELFYRQWMKECKPFGFEVQDQRLGGLVQRMYRCRGRIGEYLAGTSKTLEELEQTRLPVQASVPEGPLYYNGWEHNVSASVM